MATFATEPIVTIGAFKVTGPLVATLLADGVILAVVFRVRGKTTALAASTGRSPHHRIVLSHLDRLEPARVVQGPWPTGMPSVVLPGLVVGVCLDPRRAAPGGVREHAIEQCRGDAVLSERRGDNEARHPDHGGRVRSVGIDVSVEAVVDAQRRVDPPCGPALNVREIAEGRAAPESLGHGRPRLAPCALRLFRRRRHVGFEAIAGGPVGVAGERVVVEEA